MNISKTRSSLRVKFRIDRDSLGEVKIPEDAYYGAFTARAIQQYHVTGQRSHLYLIMAFVMIKRSTSVDSTMSFLYPSSGSTIVIPYIPDKTC